MGSCCFTPRRSQFLWWYWLLLASIVGIPMLLACLYVARHKSEDEQAQRKLGRTASSIFWGGTVVSTALAICATLFLHGWLYPHGAYWSTHGPPRFDGGYLAMLMLSYVGSIAVLSVGKQEDGRMRWRPIVVALLLVIASFFLGGLLADMRFLLNFLVGTIGCVLALVYRSRNVTMARTFVALPGVGFIFAWTVTSGGSVAEWFWLLAVCVAVSHFMTRFTAAPNQRNAWSALGAVVIGALLFWMVVKYSRAANYCLSQWVRGSQPGRTELWWQMNTGDQ